MKNRCKLQFHLVKQLQMLILLLSIVLGVTASAAGNSSGLDSFCGFTAGEMRKDGRIGNLEQVETKAKKRFRKFERVGLKYSKDGRLCELCTGQQISGAKTAAGKKAKKEFDECINWFQKAGIVKAPLEANEEWNDNTGGTWTGRGAAKTREADFEVTVQILACYRNPDSFKGDRSGQATGWLVNVFISWKQVDKADSILDARGNSIKKAQKTDGTWNVRPYPQISVNVKKYDPTSGISRREFIEQTFGVKFGEELKNYIELKPSENDYIDRNMTKPICGMEVVEFIQGRKNKLEEIRMRPPCETSRAGGWWFPFETYKLADLDVAKEKAKEECAKLCKLVEEWLMLEHLEVNGYEFLQDRLIEENKTAKFKVIEFCGVYCDGDGTDAGVPVTEVEVRCTIDFSGTQLRLSSPHIQISCLPWINWNWKRNGEKNRRSVKF